MYVSVISHLPKLRALVVSKAYEYLLDRYIASEVDRNSMDDSQQPPPLPPPINPEDLLEDRDGAELKAKAVLEEETPPLPPKLPPKAAHLMQFLLDLKNQKVFHNTTDTSTPIVHSSIHTGFC